MRKLRSTVFPMLVKGGLFSEDGRILQAVLSTCVADKLNARTPSDVRFFQTGGIA